MTLTSHPPEDPKTFLRNLATAIRKKSVGDLKDLYINTYPILLEQQCMNPDTGAEEDEGRRGRGKSRKSQVGKDYSDGPWVMHSNIDNTTGGDRVTNFLYKELYHRSLYQNKDIPVSIRTDSWENYRSFFTLLQQSPIGLPLTWLWDIFDEFLYQTQINCHARCRETDTVGIRKITNIWNPITVIQMLEGIARLSDDVSPSNGEAFSFYAKVMLVRIHTQLGDYFSATRIIEEMGEDITDSSGEYAENHRSIAGCLLTLYYYGGFACLMMRRYSDAQRLFLSAISCKSIHAILYQQQNITNILRQTCTALAISLVLAPRKIDEYTKSLVKEAFEELSVSIQDEETFKESYKRACPKYIVPTAEEGTDSIYNLSPFTLMESHCMFLFREVQQQSSIFTLRSYLKLYTNIAVEKLAYLQSVDALSETSLTCQLLSAKHKSFQKVMGSKPPNPEEGHMAENFELTENGRMFYVEGDAIVQPDKTSIPSRRGITSDCIEGTRALEGISNMVEKTKC